MTIEFACNKCGRHLRAPKGAAGRESRCPDCGNVAAVPAARSKLSELVSAVATRATQGKLARPTNDAMVDRNWSVLIIVATIVVCAIVIILVAHHSFSSQRKKVEERDRLTKMVDEEISTAKVKADAFVFAAAVGALDKAEREIADSFLAKEYVHDELLASREVVRERVRRQEMDPDYRAKIRDGWILFEGRFLPGSERERILAERKQEAEQEERRRAAATPLRQEERGSGRNNVADNARRRRGVAILLGKHLSPSQGQNTC